MGMSFMGSRCTSDGFNRDAGGWSKFPSLGDMYSSANLSGNPKPDNYSIEKYEAVGDSLVVLVHYPDCKNYEGRKILVFKDVSVKKLLSLRLLDPHFCNSTTHPSPVARFEPTKRGWQYAISFCNCMQ